MTQWLAHWIHPRLSNQHHPRLLHADSLISLLALVLISHVLFSVQFGTPMLPNMNDVLGQNTRISTTSILDAINAERIAANQAPLRVNKELNLAAEKKAQDMLENNYWAHTSPGGRTPWSFIDQTDYKYSIAGENLARNFTSTDTVVRSWMNSPTHRANLQHTGYVDTGVAVVRGTMDGKETTLIVQLFATPTSFTFPEFLQNVVGSIDEGAAGLDAELSAGSNAGPDAVANPPNNEPNNPTNTSAAGVVGPPVVQVLGTQLQLNATQLYRTGMIVLLVVVVAVLVQDELQIHTRGKFGKKTRRGQRGTQHWAHLSLFLIVVGTLALAG